LYRKAQWVPSLEFVHYIKRYENMTRAEKMMLIGMYIAATADVVVAIGVILLLL
jgi:hypothetical protein